jgi:hypothetical protein
MLYLKGIVPEGRVLDAKNRPVRMPNRMASRRHPSEDSSIIDVSLTSHAPDYNVIHIHGFCLGVGAAQVQIE